MGAWRVIYWILFGIIQLFVFLSLMYYAISWIVWLNTQLLNLARAARGWIRQEYSRVRSPAASGPIPMSTPSPVPMPVPAPVSMPARVFTSALGVTVDEIEQLPRYEPLPPLPPLPPYERIAKTDEQQPVEMRDLERGESSRTTASHSGDPPEYQAVIDSSFGDERIFFRRIETDGGRVGEQPPAPPSFEGFFGRFTRFSR